MSKIARTILIKLRKEIVFTTALSAAVITSFIVPPDIRSIDLDVILVLFSLMLVSKGLEQLRVYDRLAAWTTKFADSESAMALVMVWFTAIVSMFITNDVALLTVVPVTLMIGRKTGLDPYRVVTFEILAANIGSSLTPFGNPQNIYIFNCLVDDPGDFMKTSLLFVLPGMLILTVLTLFLSKEKLVFDTDKIATGSKLAVGATVVLFAAVLASSLKLFDIKVAAVVVFIFFLIYDRKLILKIDYFLLMTFGAFFIFVDNLSRIPAVSQILRSVTGSSANVFLAGAGLSQIISNVPAAMVLGPFTWDFRPLLIGVSAGGLGTLVASLANLIAYKLYSAQYPSGRMLKYFTMTNLVLLLISVFAFYMYFK